MGDELSLNKGAVEKDTEYGDGPGKKKRPERPLKPSRKDDFRTPFGGPARYGNSVIQIIIKYT